MVWLCVPSEKRLIAFIWEFPNDSNQDAWDTNDKFQENTECTIALILSEINVKEKCHTTIGVVEILNIFTYLYQGYIHNTIESIPLQAYTQICKSINISNSTQFFTHKKGNIDQHRQKQIINHVHAIVNSGVRLKPLTIYAVLIPLNDNVPLPSHVYCIMHIYNKGLLRILIRMKTSTVHTRKHHILSGKLLFLLPPTLSVMLR